jgi:hypothetical protein
MIIFKDRNLYKVAFLAFLGFALSFETEPALAQNWQQSSVKEVLKSSTEMQLGIRDKFGDKPYVVEFVVTGPSGTSESKKIQVFPEEFGYVRYPSDFGGNAAPGKYSWKARVNGKDVIKDSFSFEGVSTSGGKVTASNSVPIASPQRADTGAALKPPAAASASVAAPNPSPNPSNNEFFKNGMPCIQSVCIGDDITMVTGITWAALNPIANTPAKSPSVGAVEDIKRVFKAPDGAIRKIAVAREMLNFDASAIAALRDVEFACGQFSTIDTRGSRAASHFLSASGHVTKVEFQPTFDSATKAVVFKVVEIVRTFDGVQSSQQETELVEALKKSYKNSVKYDIHKLKEQNKFPTVALGSYNGKPQIVLKESHDFMGSRTEYLQSNPKCSSSKPVGIN